MQASSSKVNAVILLTEIRWYGGTLRMLVSQQREQSQEGGTLWQSIDLLAIYRESSRIPHWIVKWNPEARVRVRSYDRGWRRWEQARGVPFNSM